jgi:hypothetical protein
VPSALPLKGGSPSRPILRKEKLSKTNSGILRHRRQVILAAMPFAQDRGLG